MTKINWTTKSGHKIEASFAALKGSSLVGVDYVLVDGKQAAGSIRTAGLEFRMSGQKFITPIPDDVRAQLDEMAAESGKMTEAQIWANEQADKYEASVRKVYAAMNK
jgi:hypothetical protein